MKFYQWGWIVIAAGVAIMFVWLRAWVRSRWRESPSERAMRLLKKKYERKRKGNQRR